MRATNPTLPVVTQRLRKLLVVVLVLIAVLVIDSAYLASVTFAQWLTGSVFEDSFFQFVFLVHLVLGIGVLAPLLVFVGVHVSRAIHRPNRVAVRLGLGLFAAILVLFLSGLALTRGIPGFEVQDEDAREFIYWIHILAPLAVVWLFLLHRLSGPTIRWRAGALVLLVSVAIGGLGTLALLVDFKEESAIEADFFPALASTSTGGYLDAHVLMKDDYCASCHQDIHEQWLVSAHRFASFNNPAYAHSVNKTRAKVLARDGDVSAARFCAGCHDPLPLFTGLFDDPEIDFVDHPLGHVGITCLSCHAIESVPGARGNAEYVIGTPEHYPFADSENSLLQWVSGMLIKGKPGLHKSSFIRPFHREAEFCATCHKVHLPEELNDYKWLRGQNHYDSFLLSGVSGTGLASFYYPEQATQNCNSCHMPWTPSLDLASSDENNDGITTVRDHLFPAANTALPHLLDFDNASEVIEKHQEFLRDSVRVDVFGYFEGTDVDGRLIGPLRPDIPALEPGKSYVFNVVVRTLTLGHLFTQGTSDSNQVWLRVVAETEDGELGHSGKLGTDGKVDAWSHFLNAYVVDRNGNRIAERNAEDIFTKLYDHQIGPGSAATVHYRLDVPAKLEGSVRFSVQLLYRKFDTEYMQAFQGSSFQTNDLPISLIAQDEVIFPVRSKRANTEPVTVPIWMRWNDFGIGMLNKPERRGLRQAEYAFKEAKVLNPAVAAINLARVYLAEGRLEEALNELADAQRAGGYPWSIAWFSAKIHLQLGNFDVAIKSLEALNQTQFAEAHKRLFDFSKNYNLKNTLALAYFERSKLTRDRREAEHWLIRAEGAYNEALEYDVENVTAHYGLTQVYERLSRPELAAKHRRLHSKYRIDDNAKDRAINKARQRDPVANFASEAVVVYELQRGSNT